MSLRSKLILLVGTALTLGVAAVVVNAVRLYSRDATDTLYVNADLLTAAKAREAKMWLESVVRRVSESKTSNASDAGESAEVLVVQRRGMARPWIMPQAQQRVGITPAQVEVWWQKQSRQETSGVQEGRLPSGERVLLWASGGHRAVILLDGLLEGFQEAGPYQLQLVKVDATPPGKRTLASGADVGGLPAPLLESIRKSPVERAFQEFEWQGQRWLGAFARLSAQGWTGGTGWTVVSLVPARKAYETSEILIQRSVWIALFVLSCVLLASMVWVDGVLRPVAALRLGAMQVAQGNFTTRVEVKTRDELAELATSFNRMSSEISHLMVQTADKARMDKELETARHVQNTMFPPTTVSGETYTIESYYQPAAECGGDWWGVVELPRGRLLLAIGDATGHGVPSAMVTATAKATMSVLRVIGRTSLDVGASPKLMMQLLNRAVYESTRGQVLMTFFLAVLDTESGVMDYVSASHEPVYWWKSGEWDVLPAKQGPRLGQPMDPAQGQVFTQERVTLGPEDALVLMTDGVVEAKNPAHDEWGDRRFLRVLKKNTQSDAAGLKKAILQGLEDFREGEGLHDDVTLAVLKRKPRGER